MRKAKGFTQKYISTEVGIAVSTYNQYENGTRGIPKETADKVAKILGVKVDEIFLPTKFTVNKT